VRYMVIVQGYEDTSLVRSRRPTIIV